jgi:hypothetical protein
MMASCLNGFLSWDESNYDLTSMTEEEREFFPKFKKYFDEEISKDLLCRKCRYILLNCLKCCLLTTNVCHCCNMEIRQFQMGAYNTIEFLMKYACHNVECTCSSGCDCGKKDSSSLEDFTFTDNYDNYLEGKQHFAELHLKWANRKANIPCKTCGQLKCFEN